MKKLIFTLLFIPFTVMASGEIKELSEKELSKKFISVIKDLEVEKKLEKSTEFNECIKNSKFDPKDTSQIREQKASSAQDCFKRKLENSKDPKALEKLADSFGLQSYGLIESKDNKSIQEYLSDKLYKSMTGIDRKEAKSRDMLKFENRKLVDQEMFVRIYTNHIAKSVLFEINRFCFENLRQDGKSNSLPFVEHWSEFFAGGEPSAVNDSGNGEFGDKLDGADTAKSYEMMFKGITGTDVSPDRLGEFFEFCAGKIPGLCKKFKDNPEDKVGAHACLTQSRLQEARTALKNSKTIQEQFDKDLTGGFSVGLKNQRVQFFDAKGDNSINNLSTVTSYDIMEGGKQKAKNDEELAQKCQEAPESSECEGYLVVDDSRLKAEQSIDIELRLKKEIELARIRELKDKDQQSLEKYLEQNGYLDILDKVKKGELATIDFDKEVGSIFDAKREATLASVQQKLGKRQMSEDELKTEDKGTIVSKNVEEIKRERARMAQVVLFNNVVSSYIRTTDKSGKDLGRYGGGWKNEEKALEGDAKVDESLFAGFKQSFKGDTGESNDKSVADITFLDTILGAPSEPTSGK